MGWIMMYMYMYMCMCNLSLNTGLVRGRDPSQDLGHMTNPGIYIKNNGLGSA